MCNLTNVFKERLKRLREIEKLSQTDAAKKIGITRETLSYYESGKRRPDIEVLNKISNAYEVSCDYLLGKTDIKSSDASIKDICKYTGLSERVINHFHTCVNNNSDVSSHYLKMMDLLFLEIKPLYKVKRKPIAERIINYLDFNKELYYLDNDKTQKAFRDLKFYDCNSELQNGELIADAIREKNLQVIAEDLRMVKNLGIIYGTAALFDDTFDDTIDEIVAVLASKQDEQQ